MEELRARWELPSIAHFVATFHRIFQLPELHVEELETAFLTSCTTEGSDLLNQLLAALLAGYYNSKNIEYYNYESSLRDCLHQNWQVKLKKSNPLASGEFRNVTLHDKVDILYSLCMYRLDADDVIDAVKGMHGEDMRVEPVGMDSESCTYWNFNDERLYKETKAPDPPKEKHRKKHKHKHKHKKKKGKHRDSVESEEEEEEPTPPPPPPQYGEWSLVCSTEEEWQTLVKSLKKNKHKQDKKLKKIIVNDFLPLIADIIVEKDKAMKKRMLEMLPKRESNRLARKKAEVDEQKAILAKFDAEEREEDRQKEAEKKKYAEQRRKEDLAREREERIRAREDERKVKETAKEERAMRALMREHKLATGAFDTDDNSMSGESSEETDWEDYKRTGGGSLPSRQSSRRQKNRKPNKIQSFFGPKEYEKISRILYQLQRNGNCWPFMEPVTRDIAPDYFDVIEKPMDISELRRKSSKKLYSSKQQFIDDFNLIVDNCTKYNGETSEYGTMALNLKEKFDMLVEKAFPLTSKNGQRSRPAARENRNDESSSQESADTADERVNYAEDSSSESDQSDGDADMSDSSQSSYGASHRGKKTTNKPSTAARKPNKTVNRKNNGRAVQPRGKQKSVSAGSDESQSSESEEDVDVNSNSGNDIYKFMMSRNPTAPRSLSMSQSQQILMDGPDMADSPAARGMFGIARRQSTSQTSQPNYDIASSLNVTTNQNSPKLNGNTSEDSADLKSPSMLSPGSANKGDRNTDLARWLGKSPAAPKTDQTTNGTNSLIGSTENNIKVQPISKPAQPFQGLFAQLKRGSTDSSPTEPALKRVA